MTRRALAGSRVRLGVFEESGSTAQAASMWGVSRVKEVVASTFETITRFAVVTIPRTLNTLVVICSRKHVASLARLARNTIKTVGAAFLAFNTGQWFCVLLEVSFRTGIEARGCSNSCRGTSWGKAVSSCYSGTDISWSKKSMLIMYS